MNDSIQQAVFGGGCFWCTEAIFKQLKGVTSVRPGYAGGKTDNPTYEEVSMESTGHAEVIRIEFDPSQITYNDLLTVFFATHDPTTLNQQGNDIGSQYRSMIFYTNDEQRAVTEQYIKQLEQDKTFDKPIVTEVKPLEKFFGAEEYHIDYFAKNQNKSYCQIVISPKVAKLRQKFTKLLK